MSIYQIFSLLILSLINLACVTTTDNRKFTITIYDSLGYKINKINYLAKRADVLIYRDKFCNDYNGARINIIDIETNQHLKDRSPYQCQGNNFIKSFIPPNKYQHNQKTYQLIFNNSTKDGKFSTYEYTTKNQTLHNWTTLITFNHYLNGKFWGPKNYIKSMQASARKRNAFIRFSRDKTNAFTILMIRPSSQNYYYELNVQKSFHLQNCNGLVTKAFSKKFDANTTERKDIYVDNIMQYGVKIAKQFKKNHWIPNCRLE